VWVTERRKRDRRVGEGLEGTDNESGKEQEVNIKTGARTRKE
jgi:hypothetical protein